MNNVTTDTKPTRNRHARRADAAVTRHNTSAVRQAVRSLSDTAIVNSIARLVAIVEGQVDLQAGYGRDSKVRFLALVGEARSRGLPGYEADDNG